MRIDEKNTSCTISQVCNPRYHWWWWWYARSFFFVVCERERNNNWFWTPQEKKIRIINIRALFFLQYSFVYQLSVLTVTSQLKSYTLIFTSSLSSLYPMCDIENSIGGRYIHRQCLINEQFCLFSSCVKWGFDCAMNSNEKREDAFFLWKLVSSISIHCLKDCINNDYYFIFSTSISTDIPRKKRRTFSKRVNENSKWTKAHLHENVCVINIFFVLLLEH
jgi:hypothetical protein